jgi:hypothetical protein
MQTQQTVKINKHIIRNARTSEVISAEFAINQIHKKKLKAKRSMKKAKDRTMMKQILNRVILLIISSELLI